MQKKQPTILIAVTHSFQEPWLSITKEGQLKTWLSEKHENIIVQHFFTQPKNKLTTKIDHANEFLRWRSGRRVGQARNLISGIILFPLRLWVPKVSKSELNLIGDNVETFRIRCFDIMQFSRWKRLSVVKHFLEKSSADYLLMTTSSSYVQPKMLLEKLTTFQEKYLYAGPEINPGNDSFVSGAQTILNRDAARLLLMNKTRIPGSLLDDVAIGRTFRKLNVGITRLETLNIASLNELENVPINVLRGNHHFRLKSQLGQNRNDVMIFEALHEILRDQK